MNSENTLIKLKQFCLSNSGNEQIWTNKSATYQWNRGRDTVSGLVNGVVRKLAGIDATGAQIWIVAGSFKINEHGTVLRFTGIPSKIQKTFESTRTTSVHYSNTDNPVDFPVTV